MSRETMDIKGIWAQREVLLGKWVRKRVYLLACVCILILAGVALLPQAFSSASAESSERFTSAGDWTTYGYDLSHSNFNPAETIITASTAKHLRTKWKHRAGDGVTDQPAIATVNGQSLLFWGSWDGYVHATNANTNAMVWATNVGQTTDSSCNPPLVGVSSSPTVATVNNQTMVFVGGGDANVYALDAATGKIIWKTSIGTSPDYYIWSSPTVYNGSVYIGSSSLGDCPLTQGQVLQLDATTGQIQNSFNTVPNGCTGGGVWSTPTIDSSTGMLYATTGTQSSCTDANVYTPALIELKASDLSLVDFWQIPQSDWVSDSDFGTTPTLFTTSNNTPMVGVANKNGWYYAFNRTSIHSGPVWKIKIANGGPCPQCAQGSIASSAWDGHTLFVAGGSTTINNQNCKGSLRALNPDGDGNGGGKIIWEHCMHSGPVLGSVMVAGATQSTEIAAVSQGDTVIVVNAATGKTVARLSDHRRGSLIYAPPTIADGVIYVGNLDGTFYAYSIHGK